MTDVEIHDKQYGKQMCVRVGLEVGHDCEPRTTAQGRALALDWRVWLRGAEGKDISAFVHKVVFHLHPSSAFVYPKRVVQEPPYEIKESGCSSIDIPIHVYLKYSTKPKKIRLRYNLVIESNVKRSSDFNSIFYDFENPNEEFFSSLMKGGGELIGRTTSFKRTGGKQTLVLDSKQSAIITHKNHFIEPIERPLRLRSKTYKAFKEEVCLKCCNVNASLKQLLRSVSMSEDEIKMVTRFYASSSSYEKNVGALTLPPFNDPIYKVPELPMSLRSLESK